MSIADFAVLFAPATSLVTRAKMGTATDSTHALLAILPRAETHSVLANELIISK